jgi:hypothetical protein
MQSIIRLGPKNKTKTIVEEAPLCSICLEPFGTSDACHAEGQDLRPYSIPCSHKFHKHCISGCLINQAGTCPNCRNPFIAETINHDCSYQTLCELLYEKIGGMFFKQPSRTLETRFKEAEPQVADLMFCYESLIEEFNEETRRLTGRNVANGLCLLAQTVTTVLSFTPLAAVGVVANGVVGGARLLTTIWYLFDHFKRNRRIQELTHKQRKLKAHSSIRELCEMLSDKIEKVSKPSLYLEAATSICTITVLATNILDTLDAKSDVIHGIMNLGIHDTWIMIGGVLVMGAASYFQLKDSKEKVASCEKTIKSLQEELALLRKSVKIVENSIMEYAKEDVLDE